MKLIANECANCRRPVGYITPNALQIPTMCILCANDEEVMKEWGHSLEGGEAEAVNIMHDYCKTLQEMLR